jgi:hypothetical protein
MEEIPSFQHDDDDVKIILQKIQKIPTAALLLQFVKPF